MASPEPEEERKVKIIVKQKFKIRRLPLWGEYLEKELAEINF